MVVKDHNVKIQYGIKGSQNTTIDMFVAKMAQDSNYMFRPSVMAIIRLYNT